MSKTTPSSRKTSQADQNANLLQVINAAAGSIQRSAHSREAVFKAFEEQSAVLGWFGSIMLLDESRQNLRLSVFAYPSGHFNKLMELGRPFNHNLIGFSFQIERTPIYRDLIQSKKSCFVESNTEIIRQLLPKYAQTLQKPLNKLLGGNSAIFAPLLFDDEIQGVLNIGGPNLTPQDIPAVEVYANQIAIALKNADLFSALQASESRQRLLFDQASDGIFVYDENTVLIDVNRSGCGMLGYSREELIGKRYEDLIVPADLEQKPLQIETALSEKSIIIERRMLRKDGKEIAVEISAKLLPVSGMQAVVRDITSRIESAKALRRREKILEAIAFAAGQFLRLPSWEEGIQDVLSLLGQAANVSRVYIFKNHPREKGDLLTSQRFEWTAPGIESFIDSPTLQNLSLAEVGFGRWVKELSAGGNIVGLVKDFPESEQAVLNPKGTLSILIVPIFVRESWWGFIGFDECITLRGWETSEVDALQAAAGTIGAAIERKRINQQERRRRQQAEMLMDVTTTLTSTLNLDQVLNNILVHLQQVVPFVSACIFLIEENNVRAVDGLGLPNPDKVINQQFPSKDDKFINEMIQTRQPVLLEDAQEDPNYHAWGGTQYVRGWMGVPLFSREKVIGYVTLDSDEIGAYGKDETQVAQAFVNQAATAIQNAQLFVETQRLLGQTQEQTQLLQQIMNIVPNGIVLLDPAKRVVLTNQSGKDYLNKLAEMTPDGRINRIGTFTIDELYQPNPSSGSWQEIEFPNGQLIFEAAVWPLDRRKQENYQVLVIQDITEERSKQSYRAAQERLAIVGQLAAGIAHDFNNIMAVILLYTQLLLQMPDLPPKEEKRLVTIYEQSQRASELIHQILDFSRQSILERNPLNLIPFLKELTYLLKRTLPENIDVILDYEEGQNLINGDPTRIQQIIMNLALNSKDAMPEGGTLRLRLRKKIITKKSEIPLPDMLRGNWLWLEVSDSGSGITAENLPHIFEPFFTTKPFGQGTGLGLAQVYGIVKQHEGFINVRSTNGEGTTFSIYFPIFETETTNHTEASLELPRSSNHETIMVVEDNKNAREAIVEILDMLNYKTLSAANGVEALALFQSRQGNIDLILSDVVMPSMDGAALHNALTRINPKIKMIMMTGYPLDQSGDLFLKQNVVAWIQKPLHTEQIALTVYQALNDFSH